MNCFFWIDLPRQRFAINYFSSQKVSLLGSYSYRNFYSYRTCIRNCQNPCQAWFEQTKNRFRSWFVIGKAWILDNCRTSADGGRSQGTIIRSIGARTATEYCRLDILPQSKSLVKPLPKQKGAHRRDLSLIICADPIASISKGHQC